MKRLDRVGLWWPPLLVMLAPLFGMVPANRDLIDFFAPMRSLTASMLSSGIFPWINLANGCGEAWFANPETAVLYPPAWLHLIIPGAPALAVEIALHLCLLSLGVGLVARQLGARRPGRTMAEVAAWAGGPVLVTVGVLNNLETLTWLPWMVLAARLEDRRSMPLVAATTALAWLGGEPQVWAMGVALTIAVAHHRLRVLVGLALGVAVIAVQLVPFLFWVAEGDRGRAATWLLRGAITPAEWVGVLVPVSSSNPGRMIYAESIFLGAPVLLCALLGGWRQRWLLIIVALLGLLATLPEIGAGGLFVSLTAGLVRYPSRFALVGLALLLPAIGKGVDDWLGGRGRWLAVVLAMLTLGACALTSHPWRWWVSGLPALITLIAAVAPARKPLRAAPLIAGAAALVVAGLPLLGLRPVAGVRAGQPVWFEAVDGGRVYAPTPAEDIMQWLASDLQARRMWPVGYLNLDDGLALVRTDAPIANEALALHIATADQGPARRWWLDTLAAAWVILPESSGVPEAMDEVACRGGLRLLRNHRAVPVVGLAGQAPDPERSPTPAVGELTALELGGNRCSSKIVAVEDAWAWISLAPVSGWRWRLDGHPVELRQGPGIVQLLELKAGEHRLDGLYRPPGLAPMAALSCCALLTVVFWFVFEARRRFRAVNHPSSRAEGDRVS